MKMFTRNNLKEKWPQNNSTPKFFNTRHFWNYDYEMASANDGGRWKMISWLGRTFRAKNDMDTISHITRYEIWYIDMIYILQKILHRMGENYRKSRKKIRQWPQPNQQEIFIKIFKKKNNLPCESKIILVKSECPKFLKKQNFLQLIFRSDIFNQKGKMVTW